MSDLSKSRLRELLAEASRARLWVVGDVMLDQFVWGRVSRISPEAPVPVVDFDRENLMPGAANVARNVTALGGSAELAGVIGRDEAGQTLRDLLASERIRLPQSGERGSSTHHHQDAHRCWPTANRAPRPRDPG